MLSKTNEEIQAIFRNRFMKAYAKSDLNSRELAQLVRMAQPNVSHYKDGYSVPGLVHLTRIACALEVSVDYLVGLADE